MLDKLSLLIILDHQTAAEALTSTYLPRGLVEGGVIFIKEMEESDGQMKMTVAT
jgi:hypothetical protein